MVHPFLVSIPKAARTSLFLLARNESAGRPEEENIFSKVSQSRKCAGYTLKTIDHLETWIDRIVSERGNIKTNTD